MEKENIIVEPEEMEEEEEEDSGESSLDRKIFELKSKWKQRKEVRKVSEAWGQVTMPYLSQSWVHSLGKSLPIWKQNI